MDGRPFRILCVIDAFSRDCIRLADDAGQTIANIERRQADLKAILNWRETEAGPALQLRG